MSDKLVWVEVVGGLPVRIFKHTRAAMAFAGTVGQMMRYAATESIRRQVFKRDDFKCTHCGAEVTWDTGHMHERQWRGKGGEISLDNSVVLCDNCHSDDPVAGHGKRRPQFNG